MSRSSDAAVEADHGAARPTVGDVPRTVVLLDRETSRFGDLSSAFQRHGIDTLAAETSFAEAFAAIVALRPAIVVLDAGLRDRARTSIEIVALLRGAQPDLKIVCLADAHDRTALATVFAAGADALFLRESSPAELAQAVWRLVRDDTGFVPVAGWLPAERCSHRRPSPLLVDGRADLGATRRRHATRPGPAPLPGCSPA